MAERKMALHGQARRRSLDVVISAGIFVGLYGLLIVVSPIAAAPFLITNFVVLASTLAIAAMGTALVLIVGGFDLSVAGIISLTNVIAATAMAQYPDLAWLIAALLIVLGGAIGAVNGILVSRLGLPSLGVTLSTYIVLTGIALIVLPAPGGFVPPDWAAVLTGNVGPIPFAAIVLLVLALLWVLFTRTRTGMTVFAVGGDARAARLSGIPVMRVQVLAYAIAGAIYACAGLFFSALTATGSPNAGTPFLLSCFAAAALGLVSFRGGKGSAVAAIFGAATLTVLPKLLFSLGLADFWVGAFQGVIVLIALSIPAIVARLSRLGRIRRSTHVIPVEATR